jgi:hypothetical protein
MDGGMDGWEKEYRCLKLDGMKWDIGYGGLQHKAEGEGGERHAKR